ncbi:MAG: hypothetical protein WCK79_05435 [Actinomycetes bacterium]
MKHSPEDESFSIEDSEELIESLKAGNSTSGGALHSALKTLSEIDDLPKGSTPPALPSGIKEVIYKLPTEFSKARTAVVSGISLAILVSATLTAAAVTNTGPAPLVKVAHETAKFVKQVAGVVTKAVTGSGENPSPTPTPSTTPTSATPTPTPSTTTTATPTPTPTHVASTPTAAAVVPSKSPTPVHSEKPSPTPTKNEDSPSPTSSPTSKAPAPITSLPGLTPPVVSAGGGEDDDHEGSSTRAPRTPSASRSPGAKSTKKAESNSEEDD